MSSIFKRPRKKGKPSWRLQFDAGKDADGNRIRICDTFDTKADAEAELDRLKALYRAGAVVRDDPSTFGAYCTSWLKTHAEAKLADKTAERYRSLLAHVTSKLGAVPLGKISALKLEEVYAGLYDKVSAKTVEHVHGAVHSALAHAVRLKLLAANPATACVLRAPEPTEAAALESSQIDDYLGAAAGEWVNTILRIGADSGCRRGEILALQWSDLNFETGLLVVSKSLSQTKGKLAIKTTKGRRTRRVTLSPSTLQCLQLHREAQEQARALFGPDYRSDLDLIFAAPDGDYLLPSSVSRACVRIARAAGLDRTGLHTLRHSHASILLSGGAPLPVVSKRLGHSDTYTTARIYSHALPSDERSAADLWESIRKAKMVPNGATVPKEGETRHDEAHQTPCKISNLDDTRSAKTH